MGLIGILIISPILFALYYVRILRLRSLKNKANEWEVLPAIVTKMEATILSHRFRTPFVKYNFQHVTYHEQPHESARIWIGYFPCWRNRKLDILVDPNQPNHWVFHPKQVYPIVIVHGIGILAFLIYSIVTYEIS